MGWDSPGVSGEKPPFGELGCNPLGSLDRLVWVMGHRHGKGEGGFRCFGRLLLANLSLAQSEPLVARQLFQTHGAASTDFVRADSDLGTHAKFRAIGESS